MRAVHLNVAVRAEQQQSRALQIAAQVHQQVERAAVGVVQVLQHHHQRLRLAGDAQEVGHSLKRRQRSCSGSPRRRRPAPALGRAPPGQCAPPRRRQRPILHVACPRRAPAHSCGVPRQRAGTAETASPLRSSGRPACGRRGCRVGGQLLAQAGLANARFAQHRDQRALARHRASKAAWSCRSSGSRPTNVCPYIQLIAASKRACGSRLEGSTSAASIHPAQSLHWGAYLVSVCAYLLSDLGAAQTYCTRYLGPPGELPGFGDVADPARGACSLRGGSDAKPLEQTRTEHLA